MPAKVGVSEAISANAVGRRRAAEIGAQLRGERADDLEVGPRLAGRLERRSHPLDAAVEVGERAVLLEEGRRRQDDVGERGGLGEEDLLRDDQLAGVDRCPDVAGVGVGLGDVLAEDDTAP